MNREQSERAARTKTELGCLTLVVEDGRAQVEAIRERLALVRSRLDPEKYAGLGMMEQARACVEVLDAAEYQLEGLRKLISLQCDLA